MLPEKNVFLIAPGGGTIPIFIKCCFPYTGNNEDFTQKREIKVKAVDKGILLN